LKKLREEITNAYISWEGKIVLEQSPTQPPDQPTQPPAQPKKNRNLSDRGGKPSGVWISQMTTYTVAGSFVPAVSELALILFLKRRLQDEDGN
jgi:hypothetical protein